MSSKRWPALNLLDDDRGKREAEVLKQYDETVIKNIADTLPRVVSEEARERLPDRIRDWALGYAGLRAMEAKWESDRTRKAKAQGVAKAARALNEAFAELSDSAYTSILTHWPGLETAGMVGLLSGYPDRIFEADRIAQRAIHSVLDLALAAESADSTIHQKRGRRTTSRARRVAVMVLGAIYIEMTGLKPTRRWNPYTGTFYGPFRAFVIAALSPLDGSDALKGIDRQIGDLLSRKTE